MVFDYLDVAIEALDKANANLEPELMTVAQAKSRMEVYARARRQIDYGLAALARRVDGRHRGRQGHRDVCAPSQRHRGDRPGHVRLRGPR
jgi:hypothetical protein